MEQKTFPSAGAICILGGECGFDSLVLLSTIGLADDPPLATSPTRVEERTPPSQASGGYPRRGAGVGHRPKGHQALVPSPQLVLRCLRPRRLLFPQCTAGPFRCVPDIGTSTSRPSVEAAGKITDVFHTDATAPSTDGSSIGCSCPWSGFPRSSPSRRPAPLHHGRGWRRTKLRRAPQRREASAIVGDVHVRSGPIRLEKVHPDREWTFHYGRGSRRENH